MEYIYGLQIKKYLHIHDWNYWWGYYRCGQDWEPFHAAEFSLSEDEAGEAPFFHFDFHNLLALHQTIRKRFVKIENGKVTNYFQFRNSPLSHHHALTASSCPLRCPCFPC